jgi:uncharacterized protein (TIGR01777 family)
VLKVTPQVIKLKSLHQAVMRKLVIAGANGFLGRYLSRHFHSLGWEVVGLARRQQGLDANCRYVNWDGKSLGDWAAEINGADVLVNLAGRSVNCRYSKRNKRQIINSRVESTSILGEAIAACENPPAHWINASTLAVYADLKDKPQCEGGKVGEGFSVEVAKAWEGAFFKAQVPDKVRRVALRISLVMAKEPGTVYSYLLKLSKMFLGGPVGGGKQMVSWIHVDDFCRAVEWLIEHPEIRGAINITSPEPLTNKEMMRRFRKLAKRPFGLPAAVWMVQIGAFFLRTEAELVLKNRWVIPKRLQQNGFEFSRPELEPWEW